MKEVRLMKLEDGNWQPYSFEDAQVLTDFVEGECLLFKPRKPRNLGHHRKLFALLKFARFNMNEKLQKLYRNEEELLDDIKLATGHFETRYTATGKKWFKPKSISFGSMDQDEFQEFYDNAINSLCEHWFKGVDRDKFINELTTFE